MLVLGIETTCDETAAAIVKDGREILSNVVASQVALHKEYGGVFPEVACRSHIDMVIPVIDEALKKAKVDQKEIDLIAVAKAPGLIGAVLIGVNVAKGLSLAWNKPFIGINHVEAHLYAAMMNNLDHLEFPSLGVVISGGHTLLLKILDVGRYELIGKTIDDAIGEAFDKVASILDLPYPGGPSIEALAKTGDSSKYQFSPSVVKDNPYNFSLSGLKTKILYTVKGQSSKKSDAILIHEDEKKHIAAAFQKTAFSDLIEKASKALDEFQLKAIYLGGGVSNNKRLREMFLEKKLNAPIFWPETGLSLDNAAMISGLGYQKFIKTCKGDSFSMEAFAKESIA
jgi:N6-L-threonylcarbamoyladenine synthase